MLPEPANSPPRSGRSPRRSPRTDPVEDEEVKDCIAPRPDVFSYFMLAAPTERAQHRHFTLDAGMSYVLVIMVLAMQGILLFCVYQKVIVKNLSWVNGIMNTGQQWNMIQPSTSGCVDGNSLCSVDDKGVFTCAPPSVQLIGRWDELDVNKDGTWSRDEVMQSRETLKCKYGVDPVEVHQVLILLLQERKEHIWLHPDIKSGKAIKKNYFTYIMGDVAMCTYRNEDMCGNLVKRGIFDAPLRNGTVPRLGTSIRSALSYCRSLLEQGGLCERVLPSTYATWKIESVQECLEPRYNKVVHTDPAQGVKKSLLEVDYTGRMDYEKAKTPIFKIYKIVILFMWILLIVSQVREVWKTFTWVIQLPVKEEHEALNSASGIQGRRVSVDLGGGEKLEMSIMHRTMLFGITAVRIGMLCVLQYVGVNFLIRQTDYIGLLLDGVALIFIVEVEQIMYERVLRDEVRSTWECSEPIELAKVGWKKFTSRPDIADLFWLFLVLVISIGLLMYYTHTLVEPLYDALQCTCLSQGETCREAKTFSNQFWEQYWMKDVPTSIQSIRDYKTDFFTEGPALLSVTKKVGRSAVNLLKYHHAAAHLR